MKSFTTSIFKYNNYCQAFLGLLIVCLTYNTNAQVASLVKDINTFPMPDQGGYPSDFLAVDNAVFFTVYNGTLGRELWKTDGTEAGTVLVKDIDTYPNGSSSPKYLTNINGIVFFSANDGVNGEELWRSDGTSAGTKMVKKISSSIYGSYPKNFININGTLFFTASDGVNGEELWRSDGTETGTKMVKNIGDDNYSGSVSQLTNVNGILFFIANDLTRGSEIWMSDGTEAGTKLVKDLNPTGDAYPNFLTNVNGTLFFTAYAGSTGTELYKSDGTESGTVIVKDIHTQYSSSPSNLTGIGSVLYFTADDGVNGVELYKSDGTTNGTVLVKDIYSGTTGSYPSKFKLFGSKVLFTASTEAHGTELWETDGTTDGTKIIKDIYPGYSYSNISYFTEMNGVLYFAASNEVSGKELWKTDGTELGTKLVKDINPGGNESSIMKIVVMNNNLYFDAHNGIDGKELWKSNGTEEGTKMVKDFVIIQQGASINSIVSLNNILYFSANDGVKGTELWKSDGTEAGTKIVKDINPGASGSSPYSIININGTLFFTADDGTNGTEIWKSDGTEAGTVLVKDIYPGVYSSGPNYLINVNGTLYFAAGDATHGQELWKSDGTANGTVMVKDIETGAGGGNFQSLMSIGNTLYFAAYKGMYGTELWKSDGTSAGTVMIKDIVSSYGESNPEELVNINGTLFFSALATGGRELWKSDGTSTGTVLVKDIYSPGSSTPGQMVNLNNTLYFRATNASGDELWKSDGTSSGTVLVKDINPGSSGSSIDRMMNINGTLYFGATTDAGGAELWKSDGTALGTVMVKDIASGAGNSDPRNFANINGVLYFNADDGINGAQLWKSDGTASGTVRLSSLSGGSPRLITESNGSVFYVAQSTEYGEELFTNQAAKPEIEVVQNSTSLETSATVGFGVANVTSGSKELEFTIKNAGTSDLTVNKSITISGTNAADFTVSSELTATISGATTITIPSLGTATFKIKFDPSSDGDRTATLSLINDDSNENPFVINLKGAGSDKLLQTITFNDLSSKKYGDAGFNLTATSSSTLDVTYTSTNTSVATISGTTVTIVGVGLTSITASQSGNANYEAATSIERSLTVDKATLTANVENANRKYGETNPSFTITYSGFVNGESESIIDTKPEASTPATSLSDAGDYDITASGGSDDNYSFSYVKGSLKISKATLTVTAENKAKNYGETNPDFNLSYSGFVNGEDKTTLDTPPTISCTADATTIVGEYDITASNGSDNNYDLTYAKGKLTIKKATLTIAADNKKRKYGQQNPAFTTTTQGFVNGDNESVITAPVASTTATENDNVGQHAITLSGGSASNYSFNLIDGELTIEKATQEITFTSLDSKSYGDVDFTLNASSNSGLVISYTSSNTSVAQVSGNTISVMAPGAATITASQAGNNNFEAATSVERTLTVTKGLQSIAFNSISDKNMGDAAFDITATATSGLAVEFALISGPATISGNTVTLTGSLGTVMIKATQAGDANYEGATEVIKSFNVKCPTLAPIVTSGSTCGQGPVTLTASGSTNGNYRWYTSATGGNAINGEVNNTFITPSLSSSATYFVAINNGLCESERIAVDAEIKSFPSTPVVSQTEGNASLTLGSSSATGNQWYRNGEEIAGETGQTLELHEGGSYSVKVTINGCSSESAQTVLTGAERPMSLRPGNNIQIYPNPVYSKMTLIYPLKRKGTVNIYDITGRLKESKALDESKVEFDLSYYYTGIYLIEVVDGGKKFYKKVTKMKN